MKNGADMIQRPFIWLIAILLNAHLGNASEKVTVGLYDNPPKVFIDVNGEPAGIFVDIIEEIASSEDWDLEYRHGTWSDGLQRLENGEIQLMPDVAYTASREAEFDFHEEPVLSDWFHVYARTGSGIRSVVDLQGMRVAVLERSVQQEAFLQLADEFALQVELIPLPDYDSIFEMVSAGEADAAITNRFYGATHADMFKLEDTAVIFNPTRLYFATTEGRNAELLNTIDIRLREMKEDPGSVYYASLRRWTSEPYSFALPHWVRNTLLILAFVLIASLLGSYLLKKQVNSRTAELISMNREMEERIESRTSELAEAMERAKCADTLKSAFLATMSHELRTPLNSIIGFTGILLQELPGPLNAEQSKQLGMVMKSAKHLLALINDVLDISKIEAGELEMFPETFEAGEAVSACLAVMEPLAEEKELSLSFSRSGGPLDLHTDRRRFQQVVMNLLSNAVKFTDTGGVTVSLSMESGTCRLSVEDTGQGIEPERIRELFKPFQQLDSGLSRKHEGTGLGLSICRKLMDMMGGDIQVNSVPGRGSSFVVTVPATGKGEQP